MRIINMTYRHFTLNFRRNGSAGRAATSENTHCRAGGRCPSLQCNSGYVERRRVDNKYGISDKVCHCFIEASSFVRTVGLDHSIQRSLFVHIYASGRKPVKILDPCHFRVCSPKTPRIASVMDIDGSDSLPSSSSNPLQMPQQPAPEQEQID